MSAASENAAPARILVVDDQELTLQVIQDTLDFLGYSVLSAPSGAAAREMHAKVGGVDLVVSDYLLHDTNGISLLEKLREKQPGLKCIIISGLSRDEALRAVNGTERVRWLQKPFTLDVLADTITMVLSGHAANVCQEKA